MKYLKTYEEIKYKDIKNILAFSPYGVLVRWIIKFIKKNIEKRRILNRLIKGKGNDLYEINDLSIGSTDFTKNWSIDENDSKILLKKSFAGTKMIININKNTKVFNFTTQDSDPSYNRNFSVKISNKEYEKLIERLQFAKNIQNTLQECFYDFTDIGFSVYLNNIDFTNMSFDVSVCKLTEFSLLSTLNILYDVLYRVTSQYDLKVSKSYYINRSDDTVVLKYYNNSNIIVTYEDGFSSYELSLDVSNLSDVKTNQCSFLRMKKLIIPFKK